MEYCKLQIILHSAKGLTNVKNFGTMDPYVAVYVAEDGKKLSTSCKTNVAKKGSSSPVWDYTMLFEVTSMYHKYALLFEIMHDGKMFDRDIGQVEVPFKNLLDGDGFGEKVSYPVKISSGEVEGEIIISHKFLKQDEKNDISNECPKKKKSGTMKKIGKSVVEGVVFGLLSG